MSTTQIGLNRLSDSEFARLLEEQLPAFTTELNRARASVSEGCVVANDVDVDHDLSISAGCWAADGTTPKLLELTSGFVKRFDASFVEGSGNGAMATGESLPSSNTVHIWLIGKANGVVDVMGNNNAVSGLNPTLPTGFIYRRRIASIPTDSINNFFGFVQKSNDFLHTDPPSAFVGGITSGSTTEIPLLYVPRGLSVLAKFNVIITRAAGSVRVFMRSPYQVEETVNTTTAPLPNFGNASGGNSTEQSNEFQIWTNTSGQVFALAENNVNARLAVTGWSDLRERVVV